MNLFSVTLRKAVPAALCATLLILASCSTVPDSGRKQINVLSPSQETQMGLTEFQKYKESKPISRNSAYNAQVQRVGRRVAEVIPIENADWEFVVFDDPTPNAFALPGGKVGVHTGLFQITQSDAGLAAVLGHEIAHVYARHSGERLTAQIGAAAGVLVLNRVLKSDDDVSDGRRNAITGATAAGATLGVLKFSRRQEIEADQLGALYMARAGYDPRESVNVWVRFARYKEKKGGARMPQFLSTHPLDATRIEKLQEFMPRAMEEYKGG